MNSVAPGSSIYSPTASANYGDAFAPFEIARPGVPAKRLGTTMEVRIKTFCPFPLILDAWPFLEIEMFQNRNFEEKNRNKTS